jgi:hypothetical protein
MAIASAQKRIDEIESFLTPKEWAIRLAEDMREHPSEEDFGKMFATREYRDLPLVKPLFKLAQQAKTRYPGGGSEDIQQRIQLDQKLRTEFQTLKIFIGRINEIIEDMCERIGPKIELGVWQLELLIQEADFSRVANAAAECIEPTVERNGENQIILHQLRSFAVRSSADLVELVAHDFARRAGDVFAHDAALRLAQDQYFDSHPILFRDIEFGLSKVIDSIMDAIGKFNAFLGEQADPEVLRKTAGPIDIEKIMKDATATATWDILLGSGASGAFCWTLYRAMTEEECKPLELPAATENKK